MADLLVLFLAGGLSSSPLILPQKEKYVSALITWQLASSDASGPRENKAEMTLSFMIWPQKFTYHYFFYIIGHRDQS